jgi:RimJ/RimL family protein N-acetyltransferase
VNIESERLLVRALTPDEAEAIVAEERAGHPWAMDYPTPGDVRIAAFALAGKTAFPTDAMPWGLFVIIDKASGLFVGGIGFKSVPNERGEVEIGYGVSDSFQGRGVATEAVRAVCDFASRGALAVIAETDRDNLASQRVLEKSGFRSLDQSDDLIYWRRDVTESPLEFH